MLCFFQGKTKAYYSKYILETILNKNIELVYWQAYLKVESVLRNAVRDARLLGSTSVASSLHQFCEESLSFPFPSLQSVHLNHKIKWIIIIIFSYLLKVFLFNTALKARILRLNVKRNRHFVYIEIKDKSKKENK